MANKKLPSIDHNTWAVDIRTLADARLAKKLADKASREAAAAIDLARARLFDAMEGHPTVTCGRAILTIKEGSVTSGALTLKTGGKIPLSDVTGVIVGNRDCIPASDVQTWFGGRTSGDDIDIGGEI